MQKMENRNLNMVALTIFILIMIRMLELIKI